MATDSLKLLLKWLAFSLLILFASSVSALPNSNLPSLGIRERIFFRKSSQNTSSLTSVKNKNLKTFFYTQTLDHFNYIHAKYWGGAKAAAPIFVVLGAESSIDDDPEIYGFLTDNAARFKALHVYLEHRFYGKSVPFGSALAAMQNKSVRGYFNSAQALADYAELITYLKRRLNAQDSPVVVFGGSYGGMLASWFRLKYPHIAIGALASSAPILYFDDITPQNGYFSVVTQDFKEASESCYETIRQSWSEIDRVASQPDGLSILSKQFKTCSPLNTTLELKNYLISMLADAAQYDSPPTFPVNVICGGIDGAGEGADILSRIFAGFVAVKGNESCCDINEFNHPSETQIGWSWQTCSEMVIPIGQGSNDTMFPPEPFDLGTFTEDCKTRFGVSPRPHWVTTYYGGHDIKTVLNKFASNIIFSNGLRDPWSSGGVLANISDSVLAVYTVNGSHCLDVVPEEQSDPEWLIQQRSTEVQIIEGWITKYHADLLLLGK